MRYSQITVSCLLVYGAWLVLGFALARRAWFDDAAVTPATAVFVSTRSDYVEICGNASVHVRGSRPQERQFVGDMELRCRCSRAARLRFTLQCDAVRVGDHLALFDQAGAVIETVRDLQQLQTALEIPVVAGEQLIRIACSNRSIRCRFVGVELRRGPEVSVDRPGGFDWRQNGRLGLGGGWYASPERPGQVLAAPMAHLALRPASPGPARVRLLLQPLRSSYLSPLLTLDGEPCQARFQRTAKGFLAEIVAPLAAESILTIELRGRPWPVGPEISVRNRHFLAYAVDLDSLVVEKEE